MNGDKFLEYKKDANFLEHVKALKIFASESKRVLDILSKNYPLPEDEEYEIDIKQEKLLIVKKKK